LQLASVLYSGFGYWMISNRQIFSNHVTPKAFSKDIIFTDHTIANIHVDQAFPLFIFNILLILALFVFLLKYIKDNFLFSSSQQEELMGIEELLDFQQSLFKQDLEYWIQEEMQIRKQFGYKKMKDFSFSLMRVANISFLAHKKRHEMMVDKKGISNTVCYDMLAQQKYQSLLQYIPMAHRQGQPHTKSDQLRTYVDYPFLIEN